ncbi:MAG: sugar phosphate isomerase/epimerase family protein [Candidatus Undinarchaeales archaeon]|jgi:sugar phosphate isomerase/epimerase|nr:sugar phosphate isomerase/epimerase family protein [Candidatus Undinarchaeales archaeon]MDP7493904.1 sugar phosphate isomerase/epimerase family protein [Candidatus Undinarchaeales archaeon]
MKQVFLSTTCLGGGTSASEVLRTLAEGGFKRLEMGSSHRYERELVPTIAREARELDLTLLTHNYFPPCKNPFMLNPAASDEAFVERSRAFMLEAIDAAATLGSPVYGFHPGFRLERSLGFGHVLEDTSQLTDADDAYERAVRSAGLFVDRGREAGIRILVENLENKNESYILCTADELNRFVRDVGGGLGILLDIGHLRIAARKHRFDPTRFVDTFASLVGEVHVNSNDGIIDSHEPLGPSDIGELELVRRIENDVPVVMEITSSDLGVLRENMRLVERTISA